MKARILALLAMVLGVVSCQTEPEGLDVNVGGEQEVAICVSLPEATRANSAEGAFKNVDLTGDKTIRYILQIYYNGNPSKERLVKYSDATNVVFDVRLVPDREYSFVVWADIVDSASDVDKYYNTNDLRNITLNSGWVAMDEARDAFTGVETLTYRATSDINIELTRPFAKLRVVTKDMKALHNLGIQPTRVIVNYTTSHRPSFNALTKQYGEANNSGVEHSYNITNIYNESFEGNGVNPKFTLFTDYFFATAGDVVKFEMEVFDQNDKSIKYNNFNTDIAVNRNYLTTIEGNILTDGNNVTVTVDPVFENGSTWNPETDEYDVETISSAAEFYAALNTTGEYIVISDLGIDTSALTTRTTAATGKVTTINLNGKTITVTNKTNEPFATVTAGNTLFLEGGNIVLTEDSTGSFIKNEGNVILTNSTLEDESNSTAAVVEGKVIVEENATIIDDNTTKVEGATAWLADVLANGGTFVLSEDMTLNAVHKINAASILDLNGKTITFTSNRGFRIMNGVNVVIKNGTIVNTAEGGRCVETRTGNVNLTLDAVELTATKAVWPQPFTVGGDGNNITVTINNSTIDAGSDGYGIITFNPVNLTITNSVVSGYAAIYTREANSSKGSNGSVINVFGSTLIGLNNANVHESNSFSTISIGDNGVTLNVDANSTIKAIANTNPQTIIGIGSDLVKTPISGVKATIAADLVLEGNSNTSIVGLSSSMNGNVGGNTIKIAAKYVDDLVADGYIVSEPTDGLVTVSSAVAMIGTNKYKSLNEAVAAVEDGGTITLVADEVFTEKNYYDNGGWKDGLGYAGDKSFTIDLGGKTVSQNGALNDYLIWIKNVGSKANTITIKNGTLDAGTTAFCALCTASSHDNQLTINLENVNLINNHSNGSTIKVRAGSVVNVNAGSKITGKNSYLGIENWNATVNVYDGAEIYMNGTSSYNGCLIGVGGNGTVNVYGGYGKGVSGGLIAMTSGGTINVSGGEWIANTDGTYANSNKSVLVAQSDKQYNPGAGNAVVNVTGGTFKGGYNCYGNAVGDAQINIKGGNFNANPKSYVVTGYEANEENGVWTVSYNPYYDHKKVANGLYKKDKTYVAINGEGLVALSGMTIKDYEIVTLGADIDLTGVEFNGLSAFNSETPNTFDGNNYKVSNWTNYSGASDLGFFKSWVGTIKNVKFENCHLKTAGRSAIVAANTYCNIENVHVTNSSIEDSNWACGIVAGLYNSGSISNCTVTNSSVKSNGGTGGIVGCINESAGDRSLTNCTVSNCTINNTGAYGEDYPGGGLVGMFNVDGATYKFENCSVSNNTLKGGYVYVKYPEQDGIIEE